MHGVFRAEVGNNHLGRWRNITSHPPAAPWSANGRGPRTAHPGHGSLTTQHDHWYGRHGWHTRTALCHCHRTGRGSRRAACAVRSQRRCIGGSVRAVPGAQQLTGGAGPAPRLPHAAPLAPARAAGACATPLPRPAHSPYL